MADKKEDTQLLTQEKVVLKRPDMYRVVLLNDDYTPRDFVVWVLSRVFFKSQEESTRIMLEAHTTGRASVGVYTHDVAKTKVLQVVNLAEDGDHPLECVIEVESGGEES